MNRLISRHALLLGLAMLLLAGVPGTLFADGGGGGGGDSAVSTKSPQFDRAARLIKQERYAQAIPLLEGVVAKDPSDADAYNLLGFSTRKMGDPQKALGFYEKALSINPKHRGAHEYRGEAYLQLGQLDKAKEDLAFLNKDCWLGCEEYSDLKAAINHYVAQRR